MFTKKEFAIVSNLRFISMTNFMLSWVEHEKNFTMYNLGAGTPILILICEAAFTDLIVQFLGQVWWWVMVS